MKGGFGNLMKQAQKMQQDMLRVQDEIKQIEVEGQSGGGLVKIFMKGTHEIVRVQIDRSLLSDDKQMLEDLIAAAINNAVHKIDALSKQKMGAATAGIPLPPNIKLPF